MSDSEYGQPSGSVNWTADEWFAKYHAESLTDEFRTWWIGYYGIPGDYEDNYGEQHEYWTRCAFALRGWLAARTPNAPRQPEPASGDRLDADVRQEIAP